MEGEVNVVILAPNFYTYNAIVHTTDHLYAPWMNVETTEYGSEFTEIYSHGLKTHHQLMTVEHVVVFGD